MPRLPKPGSDAGKWGEILNEYLSTVHDDDGNLKDSIITTAQLANDTVTEATLAPEVVDKLNSAGVSSVATLTGDITSPDLVDALETDLQLHYAPVAGSNLTASGTDSWAEGQNTVASGNISHAEGFQTTATGAAPGAHAEGYMTTASTVGGPGAHAEGYDTTANSTAAHAEGTRTIASNHSAHAEGKESEATGDTAHAEGQGTVASAQASHAEGYHTTADGYASHAEGSGTTASGIYSHAEGYGTTASGNAPGSHAEGFNTVANGFNGAHAEGHGTIASGTAVHAEGSSTIASSYGSHAEGGNTNASGVYSHAEGNNTTAGNAYAHAEGYSTTAFRVAESTRGNGGFVQQAFIPATSGAANQTDVRYVAATGVITIPVHAGITSGKVSIFTEDGAIRWDITFSANNNATTYATRATGTVSILASVGTTATTYGTSAITWTVTGNATGQVIITPSATPPARRVWCELFQLGSIAQTKPV